MLCFSGEVFALHAKEPLLSIAPLMGRRAKYYTLVEKAAAIRARSLVLSQREWYGFPL